MTDSGSDVPGTIRKVIDGDYCVGCGACAALDASIEMDFDKYGKITAQMPPEHNVHPIAAKVCPFADEALDENELAQSLFAHPAIQSDERIGYFLATFAGWANEGDLRKEGSSGGLGSWLQAELLRLQLVDFVINVTASSGDGSNALFEFTVATSFEDIRANAKTRYYPVEMSRVIRHVIDNPGRYAVIGIPCFVKALRLAAHNEPVLSERLTFVLGIVCGHLKSATFAKALAWQCDLSPESVETIDFRTKLEGRPASRYGVTIVGKRSSNGERSTVTRPMQGLLGANWGHGFFKYKACEFCDDVLAETADAVVGDAWLPEYDTDHRGTNIVVVRDPKLLELLENAKEEGRVHLDPVSAEDIANSQAGGLRHRRAGLAYRLWQHDRAGHWRPKKRIEAGHRHLPPAMRRLHRKRFELGQYSHEAFLTALDYGSFERFRTLMLPLIEDYDREINPSRVRRIGNLLHRLLETLFRQHVPTKTESKGR